MSGASDPSNFEVNTPSRPDAGRRSIGLNVHGSAIDLRCALPGLRQVIADAMGEMIVDAWPDGFVPAEGVVDFYNADVVARSMSSSASQCAIYNESAELWRDGERFWLIDETWGVCELNLMRRTFRSWVLDQGQLDPVRCLEQAVLWPMSQVLIAKNVALIPAAAIIHNDRGILLISPFNPEPELSMLHAAGHAVVSQRWVTMREDDSTASRPMLQRVGMPMEVSPLPQPRSRVGVSSSSATLWTDLHSAKSAVTNHMSTPNQSAVQTHVQTRCDAILLVEPGRRTVPSVRQLTGASATAAVKRAWPMPDMLMGPKQSQMAARLAAGSQVFQVELSRDPRALLRLLNQLPTDHGMSRATGRTIAGGTSARRISNSIIGPRV